MYRAYLARRESRTLASKDFARQAVARAERDGRLLDLAHGLLLAGDERRASEVLRTAGALAEAERIDRDRRKVPSGEEPVRLTQREEQIARLAATGLSSRDIGERLGINHRTVETHLANVYEKLGFRSRVDLARYFTESSGVTR